MIISVLKSLLAKGATFPLTAAFALANTYLMIAFGGPDNFALVTLVTTLFLLIPFADLGLGTAVVSMVAQAGNLNETKNRVAPIFRALWLPAAIVVAISWLGLFAFSWSDVLGAESADQAKMDLVTATTLSVFAMSIPFGVGQRILNGLNKNHIGVLLSSMTGLVTISTTVYIMWQALDPLWLAVSPAVGTFVVSITTSAVAFRKIGLGLTHAAPGWQRTVRTALQLAGPMLLIMVALPLALQTHRLMLSHRSTVEELAVYSLGFQLYTPLWGVISTAAMALWPIFAKQRAEAKVATGFKGIYVLLLTSSAALSVGLLVFGTWLGDVLSDGTIVLPYPVLGALALLLLVQTLQQVPGMYYTSSAGLWFQVKCVAAMATSTIGLGWLITPLLGAQGPLLASSASIFVFQVVPGMIRLLLDLRGRRARIIKHAG